MEFNISNLLKDRELFDKTIYTPLGTAIVELEQRKKHDSFMATNLGVLDFLQSEIYFVIFRHLATPNFEIHRFLSAADGFGYKSAVCEFLENKFVPNNHEKKSLGKMGFFKGVGKHGGMKVDFETIVDFNKSNGLLISEVETLWGESLVDFHHFLFKKSYPNTKTSIVDASSWFLNNGPSAKSYYKHLLKIFVSQGILFENFILEDPEELEFAEKIFLPAFKDVLETTGYKPLIVPLEPTGIEGNDFWYNYPAHIHKYLSEKKVLQFIS